ncbi:hypothetical protein P691DRAFT_770093 [Macrolepiota fuliginosa MF-IS2]|uniref:Prenylcysteine lyase domain-containing protein n=1 Tax=Macrolepiota fuliginosa MF-IS2 TaxID=1400762 RepID=A0A9P5XQQ4_9AGAR|nr:hypothetical protein P691DRAFT_770093 [Macrolepiota fuliginosa MF-IS2]
MMKCVALILLVPAVLSFEYPFLIQKFFKHKVSASTIERTDAAPEIPVAPRIAVIGAGAGGSSAAFWISKARSRFGLNVEIDVYDRSDYIGGRSTTVYPYENVSLPEIELGASIFVKANKNMWRASDEFNLTRRDFQDGGSEMGLWDGEKVVFTFEGGFWGTAKVLWRYGFTSPKRTQDIVDAMIKKFVGLYSKEAPKWDDVAHLSSMYGWTELTSSSTMEYLLHQGVSRRYISELVEGATRVNYGQNAGYIHALEGLCSLAATGASGIKGGNFQVFEQFLERSNASVHLNTTVDSILPKANSKLWTVATGQGAQDYTAVILAAPFYSTGITVPHAISDQIPAQPYVHLHVTLLTTTSEYPNPTYFAMSSSAKPARTMLTTYEGVRKGGKEPEFNSLSYLGLARPGEWTVKIFSKERISDKWLRNVFNGKVGWVFRKEWDAYPKLPPTTTFPPVKLDQGFYYVNSFEPFISTMETETISSRNVVDLLLNDEFNSGICGPRISDSDSKDNNTTSEATKDEDDYVYGWDC